MKKVKAKAWFAYLFDLVITNRESKRLPQTPPEDFLRGKIARLAITGGG